MAKLANQYQYAYFVVRHQYLEFFRVWKWEQGGETIARFEFHEFLHMQPQILIILLVSTQPRFN